MDKRGIRNLGKLLRKSGKTLGFGAAVYSALSDMTEYKKASTVMIYLSIEGEAPTDEIVKSMLTDGKKVCVPVTNGRNMTPAEVDENTVYVKGAFGVRVPSKIKAVEKYDIDIVITPGLLFDRQGTRCGYGKGCYDFFLEGFTGVKMGICFACQLVNAFPSEKHDVKMDYVITEKGVVVCEKK